MGTQDNAAKKDPASDIQMGSMSQIRTLVAINQRKNLEAALTHLERNYYQLYLVNRIPDLIRGLQTHRPQVVLLSWNLKNTDVKKVYRLLTQKFHLLVIVFAEDPGTRSTASLMSSGIPNSLLAPVSGPAVHTRIQSLMGAKPRARRKPVAPAEFVNLKKVEDKAELPPNLEWTEHLANNGEKVWKAASVFHDKESDIYIFRGENKPIFDKVRQIWNIPKSEKGGIFVQERDPDSPEYSATQEGIDSKEMSMTTSQASGEMLEAAGGGNDPSGDANFDWDAAVKEAEGEISEAFKDDSEDASGVIMQDRVGKGDDSSVIKKDEKDSGVGHAINMDAEILTRKKLKDSLLAQCLKAAFGKHSQVPKGKVTDKTSVSKITICTVNSDRFCGYIVAVSSDNTYQKNFMSELMPLLKSEMKNTGEPLKSYEILDLEVGALTYLPWADQKADFMVSSPEAGVSLAFFSTPNQPQILDDQEDESVLGISLTNDIAGDEPVTFNVYIHLPKNDKYLLYLQKGQVFSMNTLNKFLGFGVATVYIRKGDKELFLAYCARNFITSTLK